MCVIMEFLCEEADLHCIFSLSTQVLDGKEDSLHVASSQKHCSLPAGQSTLKAFLRPCSNPPEHDVTQAENRVQKKRKLITSDEGSDD